MKFLVDAQLPRWLANKLRDQGHDVLHTLDLPESNFQSYAGLEFLLSDIITSADK